MSEEKLLNSKECDTQEVNVKEHEKADGAQKSEPEKNEVTTAHDVEIERISDEKMERAVAKIIQSEFSGPIPPPNIIKGYEEILPGAADRIISMAEKQSEHRQQMEQTMVSSESRDSLLGVLFAFGLGIGCIIAAIVIVIMVPENVGAISGATMGVAGIGSIIATFIKSTRVSKK